MFEPQKLITVVLGAVLLAPFAYVFWRITAFQPQPDAEVRAALLADLRDRRSKDTTPSPDGDFTTKSVAVRQIEAIGFVESTNSWLSFFPHRWVGVLGLFGVLCILAALIVSLFFAGGIEVSTRDLLASSPSAGTQ